MPRFGDGIGHIVSIIHMEHSICLCIEVMVSLFVTRLAALFHLHILARYSWAQALRLFPEVDSFPPVLSCMSHFHMTISSFGHPHEPIEMGNNQPMSSWNDQVVNPDTVAPRQQEITLLDNGGHHAAYIGIPSSRVHTVDTDAMDKTFLFSTICFQSMAHAFRSCNIFTNAIYDIFGYASDKRTENITQS